MDRSVGRGVHLYDPKNPTEPLGGLVLYNGVTNANFYAAVEIFVLAGNFILRHQDGDSFTDIEKAQYFIITIDKKPSCKHG